MFAPKNQFSPSLEKSCPTENAQFKKKVAANVAGAWHQKGDYSRQGQGINEGLMSGPQSVVPGLTVSLLTAAR